MPDDGEYPWRKCEDFWEGIYKIIQLVIQSEAKDLGNIKILRL